VLVSEGNVQRMNRFPVFTEGGIEDNVDDVVAPTHLLLLCGNVVISVFGNSRQPAIQYQDADQRTVRIHIFKTRTKTLRSLLRRNGMKLGKTHLYTL
jgi:hypothetical protein